MPDSDWYKCDCYCGSWLGSGHAPSCIYWKAYAEHLQREARKEKNHMVELVNSWRFALGHTALMGLTKGQSDYIDAVIDLFDKFIKKNSRGG